MKTRQLFISLALGLGLTLALLWLMDGNTPSAYADSPHYVAPDCTGVPPPCHTTIQAAVDAAIPGDEILVAAGTYTGVSARAGVTQVVYISQTVTIRGGYNPDFSTWDPDAYFTTLDAQGQGRVLYITGDISPTIEGLRITGGDAAGLHGFFWDAGGGVYVISATATISNNLVFSNTSDADGGGLYLQSSDAVLSGNTIMSNTAYGDSYGGGLCLVASDATLNGNTFISNTAHGGGGLVLAYSAAMLYGNTISSNTADGGGGLDLVASNATLSGNIVTSNTAYFWGGGGLYVDQGSNATLINSVVADNRADSQGSGLYIRGSSPCLLHTTIARNRGGDGSGVYITSFESNYSTVIMTNTILVSHTVGITVTGGNTAMLEATLWGSGDWANDTDWGGAGTIITGTRNYWGDPAFVASDAGDYHIGLTSAAIDEGIDAGVDEDMDSDPRPMGHGYDLGADELRIALTVTERAAPDPVQAGSQLTYTLCVTNTGHMDLHATITDTLPAQVTSGGVLTWTPPVITASGGVWTEAVVVTVETGYIGTLVNVVEVTTDEGATGIYTATVTSGYEIYLPLIMRQYQ